LNQRLFKNFITINDLIDVAERVTSLQEARIHFGMSLARFKKFASLHKDEETGLNFYELIRQKKNKGNIKLKYTPIVKKSKKLKKYDLKLVLEGYRRNRLPEEQFKFFLISGGYKKQVCETCGFDTKRGVDYKVPLKLIFKDGRNFNGTLSNLEFICYNCHFLHHPNYKTKDYDEVYDVSINTVTSTTSNNMKIDIQDSELNLEDFDKELERIKFKKILQEKEVQKDYDPYEFVTNKKLIN